MPTYTNPVSSTYRTTQPFGAFPNNGYNPAGGHTGDDKGTPVGVPVRAPGDGVITVAGVPGAWNTNQYWLNGAWAGKVVSVDCGPVVFHAAHLSEVLVRVGQKVRQGDIIGKSGNSGQATTGPHTHFEAMPHGWNFQNGTYGRVDPAIYCKQDYMGIMVLASNPNHRNTGDSAVNQRDKPARSGAIVRKISARTLERFDGYVRGELVTVGAFSSDVWFKDNIGYAWAGGFENSTTSGLPDLTPAAPTRPDQRKVGAYNVNQRKTPDTASEIVRTIEAGTKEVFTGYVRGQSVTLNGFTSDVWYVDHWGYAWAGGFDDSGVVGLPDLTVPTPPAPKPVPPAPAPEVPAVTGLNGIDVATYQESAALQLLATDFYIIKATEGGGDWKDAALTSNVAEARLAGKPVGFYHFARPLLTPENTAKEEARSFLAAIREHALPGDVLFLDWEAENQHRTDWALEWLEIVAAATESTPLVYLNAAAINGGDWAAVEARFPLWYAGYGANAQTDGFQPPPAKPAVTWASGVLLWQYTSKGRLPGYAGDLDMNIFYGTVDDWHALGIHTTAPVEEPSDVKDFANWLSGEGLGIYLGRKK